MMTKVLEAGKAVVAASAAASAAAANALVGDQTITPMEWVIVGVAAVTAFGTVWIAGNKNQPTVAQAKAQHLAGE
jgi:uncharacterized OsmC-like protein